METVRQALEALRAAARTVDGLRVFNDVGPAIDPPCVVVPVPVLTWEGLCGPTNATFNIAIVVRPKDASQALLTFLPLVVAAIETVDGAVVMRADPAVYPGTTAGDLPAYQVTVDYAL
jgi:hypothetical protein